MRCPSEPGPRGVAALLALAALAAGCLSADPPPPAPLTGTSWRAEEIDGHAVLERVESTLTFDGAQRIAGQAACNRYFGTLELGEGTIRLKPAGTTRMACPPAVMEQESRFLAALAAVTAFRREGGKLLLLDADARVRLRLARLGGGAQAPPGLENRPRSIREDARARGVEFRATGNEPGWTWELLGDRMVFVGAYGTERVATPRPPRQGEPATGEAVYAAVTEAHRLTVRIRTTPCVDTMSGDRYPSTVEVEFDGVAYRGCGEALP